MTLRALVLLSALLVTPVLAAPGDWERKEGTRGIGYFAEPETADLSSGGHPNGVSLMFSCFEDSLGVGLFLAGPVSDDPITVSLMVDDAAPWQDQWTALEGNAMVIGLWAPKLAEDFIDRIATGQRLTVQLMLKNRPATYSYDMTKGAAHIDELTSLCASETAEGGE